MQIKELFHQGRDKVIQAREIIISPVQPQQEQQPLLHSDIKPNRPLKQARKAVALALMLLGAITLLCGLVDFYVSPGVRHRGAIMQQAQRDLEAGKINWQEYQQRYREATQK